MSNPRRPGASPAPFSGGDGLYARAWSAHRHRLRRRAAGVSGRGDAGFSLVELILAMAIMISLITVTLVILTSFFNETSNTLNSGKAAETSQVQMQAFDRYLRAIINPYTAEGSAGVGVVDTTSCWSTSSPGPPASGTTYTYTLTTKRSQALAITVAHDFDVWFCGYLSTSSKTTTGKTIPASPQVYEMVLANTGLGQTGSKHTGKRTYNPAKTASPCREITSAGTKGGFCTLELLDWSKQTTKSITQPTPTHPTTTVTKTVKATTGCNPGTGTGCLTTPVVVASVSGVWCDAYCQGKSSVKLFPGSATNSSLYPTYDYEACQNLASTTCTSNSTKPLLTYYSGSSNGGQFAHSVLPLTPRTCKSTGCKKGTGCPSSTTSVCNVTSTLDLTGAAQKYTSPYQNLNTVTGITGLLSVELIQVQAVFMPSTYALKQPSSTGSPGVPLSNQIYVQNVASQTVTSCKYTTTLKSLGASAYWPMTDIGGRTATPGAVDLGLNKVTATFESKTDATEQDYLPGPLPCSPTSPAMAINGTKTGTLYTAKAQCSNTVFKTATATCPAGSTGPQNFSIVAWFKTKTAKGGIMGYGNVQKGQASTSYDRSLYIASKTDTTATCNKKGELCWGVYPGYTSVVSSDYSVANGRWHLAVATVCGYGNTATIDVCPPGITGQFLWVDGNLVGYNTSVTTPVSYAGFWQIGELPNSGVWPGQNALATDIFKGTIGQVAVINTPMTQSQVNSLYQDSGAPGLSAATVVKARQSTAASAACQTSIATSYEPVAYFPLTATTYTTGTAHYQNDIAPTGSVPGAVPAFSKAKTYPGTPTGTLSYAQPRTGTPVLCDQAAGVAKFGASGSSKITVGGTTLTGTNYKPAQLTVEAWLKVATYGTANPRIVANSQTTSTHKGFQLEIANGGKNGYFDVGNGTTTYAATWNKTSFPTGIKTTAKTSAAKWVFYVGTYDGHTVRCYIDGVQVAEAAGTGTVAASGHAVQIGDGVTDASTYFNGALSDVAVYATALGASQISQQWVQAQSVVG